MASLLTTTANELNHYMGLIFNGANIALKLNHQVVSKFLSGFTKLISLLRLLIRKGKDLLTILTNDILLFVGDIGTAVVTISNGINALFWGAWNLLIDIFFTGVSFFNLIYKTILDLFNCCFQVLYFINYLLKLLTCLIKELFILFGSTAVFLLTLITKSIYYTLYSLCEVISNLPALFSLLCLRIWNDSYNCFRDLAFKVKDYFTDIPLEAYIGSLLGFFFIFTMIYAIKIELIQLPNISSIPRKVTNIILHLYQRPIQNNEVEVQDEPNEQNDIEPNIIIPDRNIANSSSEVLDRNTGENATQNNINEQIDSASYSRPYTRSRKNTIDYSLKETNKTENVHQELQDERDSQLCIVCQDLKKCVILLPCRHLCLCKKCKFGIMDRDRTCPVCRKEIHETLPVFT